MGYARNIKEKKLLKIASSRGGYFTAKEASRAGYSYRLQHYHRAKGHWQEVDRGIFRLTEHPVSSYDELIRWSLWSRNRAEFPQAVISHESALSLHELSDIIPSKIHLTVPINFSKKPDTICTIHKRILPKDDIEMKHGIFVTTPKRTLIDVAESSIRMDILEQAVYDASKEGLIRLSELENASLSPTAREKIKSVISHVRNIFIK
ncbi:MAG: type IV toxin-antitoxin system AbiEi family antitoxin domain-containing protein [Elusimicrobia bacterium]|nr:type IV toxin-antitoxin system AbiEi family antitoxin domain-containing protein [Elusimicrobiota bacterium]